jgi:hypothetical protein
MRHPRRIVAKALAPRQIRDDPTTEIASSGIKSDTKVSFLTLFADEGL